MADRHLFGEKYSPDFPFAPARFRISLVPKADGFSLVEAVIAIGILAFCLVGVINLLGIALATSREAVVDSTLTSVLQNLSGELESQTEAELSSLTASNQFFDLYGNPTTNSSLAAYQATLTRIPLVNAQPLSGITNSNTHFLWKVRVGYPPPNFPQARTLILGRHLHGSGPHFYE